jgi:4-hydroxyphenylpyruvate dioxygenase
METGMKRKDICPLRGFDHVELFVGNARQAAYFYEHALGFAPIAYRGLETGSRELVSHVLEQGKIRLVLTSALRRDHPVARGVSRHGDFVAAIGLTVNDAARAFTETTSRGARAAAPPSETRDANGSMRSAAIELYGDVQLRFVERQDYVGPFAPGFVEVPRRPRTPVGLASIDHIVGNVELGAMDRWARFFADVLGFEQLVHFDDAAISTQYSALMSKVMQDGSGKIKFPINEPAQGKRKSQIEEYLDFHGGPGVQHLAFTTGDIVRTVSELRSRGIEFLAVPDTYYADLEVRVGDIAESREALRELGILVDRDEDGYLLQIFTRPVEDRPTLFFEVIERHGSRGFGEGNFKSLFEAIEREQELRGNL